MSGLERRGADGIFRAAFQPPDRAVPMRTLLAGALCTLLLSASACDDAIELVDPGPEPVAFSSITVTTAPMPADEDSTAIDFYAEVQGAGGRAVFTGDVVEDADASALPYAVATNGTIAGANLSYFVVVMDYTPSGFQLIGRAGPFTGDDLREAEGSFTIRGENPNGVVEATITL